MISREQFKKIKHAVHQPLNWDDYNSTSVIEDTNCLSHALGTTVTSSLEAYRLGILSQKKPLDEQYISIEEVKSLFLSDTMSVELEVEEIQFHNLPKFLDFMSNINLSNNEHIVALFIKIYGDEIIRDFHFFRFDKEIGWSEKRRPLRVNFLNDISKQWPCSWNDRLVGVFKIKR